MIPVTLSNRHQPVFSLQAMQNAFEAGDLPAVLRMAEFNREYPTRRFWHHRVHSEFGIPCDELCKPSFRKTGGSLIDRIKAAYDLEEFAGRFTRLRNRHGKCFLHGETHGESFSFFETHDGELKWKCFGACGLHGDVLDLMEAMDERGIEWRQNGTS